jgi:hypothetical protein
MLHADGTFDQHVTLNDGKQINVASQRWQYTSNGTGGDISLDKRLEFFTPEHFGKRIGEGVGSFEVLPVEINSKPVIVLNPDSDCIYEKEASSL